MENILREHDAALRATHEAQRAEMERAVDAHTEEIAKYVAEASGHVDAGDDDGWSAVDVDADVNCAAGLRLRRTEKSWTWLRNS